MWRRVAVWMALVGVGLLGGCEDDDDPNLCNNGECRCAVGDACALYCTAPPCHVLCAGDNPSCIGVCGNGDCDCLPGSHCEFDCHSPPCHVNCENDTTCSGVCANGTCTCGERSSCEFVCADGNCWADCLAGSSCVLGCPLGNPGEQGCTINCSGNVTVCPDGLHTVCNADCPSTD